MTTKTEVIKHKDIRGNELMYLRLTEVKTGNELLINIGQKTFDRISELPLTELQQPKKEDKK